MAQAVRHNFGNALVAAGGKAAAPAGHGIALGHAVDDDRVLLYFFAERCDAGEFASVVAEAVVNLVSDDVNIVTQADLRKRFQLFLGVDHAGRVGRVVEHERLRFIRNGGFKLCRRHFEMLRLRRRDDYRNAADHADLLGIANPVRRGYNDLVAGIEQREKSGVQARLGAVGDDNGVIIKVHAEVFLHAVRDRLARFDRAGRRRILRLTFPDGADAGFLDMVGRIKIRLPCPKAYDGDTLRLHLLEFRVDRQRCGRSNGGTDLG